MHRAARRHGRARRETGTELAGGDLSRAGELFLAITVVGHAPTPDTFVTRSGARAGDALVLTGEIGGAGGRPRSPANRRRID